MTRFALCITIFFANTGSNLNIPAVEHSHSNLQNTDPILATVDLYGEHPIIKRINNGPANIYLFKVNNRNTRKMCKVCSKLTIITPE